MCTGSSFPMALDNVAVFSMTSMPDAVNSYSLSLSHIFETMNVPLSTASMMSLVYPSTMSVISVGYFASMLFLSTFISR